MYFLTPTNPNIILIGIYETDIYGFGEKNEKLCIYKKRVFDIDGWKEFYMININVVKCDSCETGIHVAGGIFYTAEFAQAKKFGDIKKIWIAAREQEFTRIFSIDIDTKKFIRYSVYCSPGFTNVNLNLCCKCLSPVIRPYENNNSKMISFYIVLQKYQRNVGIFQVSAIIHGLNRCQLWKSDPFTLRRPPLIDFSNILMSPGNEGAIISVFERNEENGRICTFSKESPDARQLIKIPDDCGIDMVWHEVAFCKEYYLTRRKEDNKSFLRIYVVDFQSTPVGLVVLDNCTVDANFPSLISTHFFIAWRVVDEKYNTKKADTNMVFHEYSTCYAVPTMIVFQTADYCNIVTIPLRILSLSESAYLSLSRIPRPSSQSVLLLPVATISIYDQFFQQLRQFYGKERNIHHQNSWLSINFIKAALNWPHILPLTKPPNLPKHF